MNRGILLVNLGSPDSTSVSDVRRYLNEFLMDARVIDSPWPLRRLIVGMILHHAGQKQSAEAYHKIWTAEGSPLIVISRHLQDEAAGTRHPAGRPGDAISKPVHPERDPRAGRAEN